MNGDTYADSLYLQIQDLKIYTGKKFMARLFIVFVCLFIFRVLAL